jgi:hypothetical protein
MIIASNPFLPTYYNRNGRKKQEENVENSIFFEENEKPSSGVKIMANLIITETIADLQDLRQCGSRPKGTRLHFCLVGRN